MFKVAENAFRCEQRENFLIKLELSFMGAVVDREAGDDSVKSSELRERLIEVVFNDADTWMCGEPLLQAMKHGGRKVDRNAVCVRKMLKNFGEQAAVTGTEVEHANRRGRQQLEQRRFTFRAMRNAVGALEVSGGVFSFDPLVNGCHTFL